MTDLNEINQKASSLKNYHTTPILSPSPYKKKIIQPLIQTRINNNIKNLMKMRHKKKTKQNIKLFIFQN